MLACLQAAAPASPPAQLPSIPYPFDDQQEFWINSEPLADRDLRGNVVLVMFWTYGCYNCKNSLAWINSYRDRMQDASGLTIIGVHTPEFEHEKVKSNVRSQTAQLGIEFPVMIDNDFAYWRAMGNQWWPAFYVADKRGRLHGAYIGEVHSSTEKASRIEGLIASLLEQ